MSSLHGSDHAKVRPELEKQRTLVGGPRYYNMIYIPSIRLRAVLPQCNKKCTAGQWVSPKTVQNFSFFEISVKLKYFCSTCFVLGNFFFLLKKDIFSSMLCAATLANHGHFLHLYWALHNAWFYVYLLWIVLLSYHGLTIILFPHSEYY